MVCWFFQLLFKLPPQLTMLAQHLPRHTPTPCITAHIGVSLHTLQTGNSSPQWTQSSLPIQPDCAYRTHSTSTLDYTIGCVYVILHAGSFLCFAEHFSRCSINLSHTAALYVRRETWNLILQLFLENLYKCLWIELFWCSLTCRKRTFCILNHCSKQAENFVEVSKLVSWHSSIKNFSRWN